ncbi:MAG: pseudouridine synthase [Patescibacteria group bacterium]|nr:pseudouridine synthase [Patescibacteria group bacterium]
MRINKYIAQSTGISRRMADKAVAAGRVTINNQPAEAGSAATSSDTVCLDGRVLTPVSETITILFHKPTGCVVSREGQGSLTVYDLLPDEYRLLKPIGRLDKNSSGLLLFTNDGQLANELTHPRYAKTKIYEVTLGKPLAPLHRQMINDHGINLEDGNSQLNLERLVDGDDTQWRITMQEGRNRQIRRTFAALNYHVAQLHRTNFGSYSLGELSPRQVARVET